MVRTYFLLVLFLLFRLNSLSQTTKKVMFLGNSYTFVNNLPLMISQLAADAGDSLYYDSNTPGGYTLQGHSSNQASLALIQQGVWDYMVLQEQSQLPSFPISQVMSQSYPYAESLCTVFRQHNPCGTPLFFMTWGRKFGDQNNCAGRPPVCTYNGMDSLLNLRYRMYADSNEALVSPVGAVWHYIRDNHPGIDLYSSDNSHPSLAGTYAAACTFYTMIFGKDPTVVKDNQNLDPAVASDIRMAAKIVAYDSLSKWNAGKFVPQASFVFNVVVDTVKFFNKSKYADSYIWYFGDGDTSLLVNPVHIYKTSGAFSVTLRALRCDSVDDITKSVSVLPSEMAQHSSSRISVFPNPAGDKIVVSAGNGHLIKKVKICDIYGKVLLSKELRGKAKTVIEIGGLKAGLYHLSVEAGEEIYSKKFIKL